MVGARAPLAMTLRVGTSRPVFAHSAFTLAILVAFSAFGDSSFVFTFLISGDVVTSSRVLLEVEPRSLPWSGAFALALASSVVLDAIMGSDMDKLMSLPKVDYVGEQAI